MNPYMPPAMYPNGAYPAMPPYMMPGNPMPNPYYYPQQPNYPAFYNMAN